MKKTIISVVITAVITIVITLLGVSVYNSTVENKYSKQVDKSGLKEAKEIKGEIPEFAITVQGIYDSSITDKDIKDLKIYEISAVMTDGVYSDLYTYTGVKLNDILNSFDYNDYRNITFKSNGNLQVTFSKEEINDNMYLVFSVDGYMLPEEEPVNLLNTELNSRYSIGNVVRMDFE